MANKSERLTRLIEEQETLLGEIKSEAKILGGDSVLAENESLSEELQNSRQSNDKLKEENERLKKELETAKSALFAKMANEKLNVFLKTQKRIDDIYYKSETSVDSRLASYETACRNSIAQTIEAIDSYGSTEYTDIRRKLEALNAELSERRNRIENYKAQQIINTKNTNNKIGELYRSEPLVENEKRAALRQKSLEAFIGLNILSKAGIFLLIVGIIMLGRFAYVHMNDMLKGGFIFLLGAALIAIGEVFHKKEKTVFSAALISGGVAVLYAATATSYFAFELFGVKIAFLLCVLITAIAIGLSQQLKSQVVCAFGAVGGYLPVVTAFMIGVGKAATDRTFLPVAGGYFCLLAVVILLMTYNKRWYAAQFIGYGLHLIAIGGIATCAWAVRNLNGYGYSLPFAVCFSAASFVIYLLMPALKIFSRKPISIYDAVLLVLNTISSTVSVSLTVRNCFSQPAAANRAIGFVFLIFAVIYALLMAFSIKEKRSGSQVTTIITSASALFFSMLVVPLIFGIDFAPAAWGVEGAVLALISQQKKIRITEFTGLACMVIAVITFAFQIKVGYSLSIITFAILIAVFWIYTIRGLLDVTETGESFPLYPALELVSAAGTVGFLSFLYTCLLHGPAVYYYSEFTNTAVNIIFVLAVAAALRFGILKNKASMVFSDLAGIIIFPFTFYKLNIRSFYVFISDYYGNAVLDNKGMVILNLVLLIIVNIAVLLFFAAATASLINALQAPVWIYTAAISVSSLMIITSVLMRQFGVSFSSVIISAVYIAAACLLLFIGFKRSYTVVRSGGLVLILFAFAKLCFVDTRQLDSGWKIFSYFAFGAILIVISYFYQRFSKRLENEAETIVKKDE